MADEIPPTGEDNPATDLDSDPIAPVRAMYTPRLPPRRQRFVEEYCIDLNATQAAIRSGYSVESANREGSRLLTNADIQQAIREELMVRTAQTRITTGKVIREVSLIAFSNRADYTVGEDGQIYLADQSVDPAAIRAVRSQRHRRRVSARTMNGEEVVETLEYDWEIQLYDKMKALITLLQYLGALKLPTVARDTEAVSELLNRLPPEIASSLRGLLAGAVEGRGLPITDTEQPEPANNNGPGALPK